MEKNVTYSASGGVWCHLCFFFLFLFFYRSRDVDMGYVYGSKCERRCLHLDRISDFLFSRVL